VRGLGRSFALNRNEKFDAYMKPEDLIHFFVKAVAHGGGMIINVGPKADGQIPLLQQERLFQLGEWLKVNGEAIYGATPWEKTGEQKDVKLERIDPNIDFDWVRNTPGKPITEDDFTAVWTGFIQPLYSEEYMFEAVADDGMRFWIDGKPVIDIWEKSNTSPEKRKGKIKLKAGEKYPLKIEYYENKLNAALRLFWSSQSRKKEIIPPARFYLSDSEQNGNGLHAVYRSKSQYLCYTKNNGALYAVTLEYPGKELVLSIEKPEKECKVSMIGRKGYLNWKYENDKMYIDLSTIYHNDLPCEYAWTFKIEGLE